MPMPNAVLPAALQQRSLALNGQPLRPQQPFVLYWMRVAMRGEDNPALNAALSLAQACERPLLVYQGLAQSYPFASDRHHRFILEGARDVARQLAGRGIHYAFHLERSGHRGDHLRALAARSAAVVTEIFPWIGLQRWTETVAKQAPCPVLAVDASCLVPVTAVEPTCCDRAYRFRDATRARRQQALDEAPMAELEAIPGPRPDLPFAPLDLEQADLATLIAQCEIDHSVGPVAHTQGGSEAGLARWRDFRDHRLAHYHRRRNDPLTNGSSRLSAYLHYGQVSPFAIAREAYRIGGNGAEKFLDELLVWRELGWAFCHHHPDHETLAVLPDWARATLAEHAADPRPARLDWETLARGSSGDALWDAAQRSLRIHGELHNNLRMTWGKMLPTWTADAATALRLLIDLNHRYALDGRDPNSYTGILWCLGLFDRPFDPPQPVLGRIRGRSSRQHARRLDVAALAARTRRSSLARPPRVAVLGAGLGGLFAARILADHGLDVALVDKGRQVGGRAATRRSRQGGDSAFDHGLPAFTATAPRLTPYLEAWAERGLLQRWQPREGESLWVAQPQMQALAGHLAAGRQVITGCAITAVVRETEGWCLYAESERVLGPCEALLINTPPAQAAQLLQHCPEAAFDGLLATLASVTMTPCWAAMLEVEAGFDPGFDLLRPASGPVALAVREAAKPGRPATGCFTFQCSPDFSHAMLEASPTTVAGQLAPVISELLQRPVAAADLRCHRWRYAEAGSVPEADCQRPERGLFFCGDWLSAPGGVAGALLSGAAAAGRLLGAPPEGPIPKAEPLQASLF